MPKQGKKRSYEEETQNRGRNKNPVVVLTPLSATLTERMQYLDNFWPLSQFKLFLYH